MPQSKTTILHYYSLYANSKKFPNSSLNNNIMANMLYKSREAFVVLYYLLIFVKLNIIVLVCNVSVLYYTSHEQQKASCQKSTYVRAFDNLSPHYILQCLYIYYDGRLNTKRYIILLILLKTSFFLREIILAFVNKHYY